MDNNINYVSDYMRWVKIANRYAETVIGGSAFTTYPVEMMNAVEANYGFQGQAENTFSDFLSELQNSRTEFKTPGVVWRDKGEIKSNPKITDGYEQSGRINWDLIDRKKYGKSYYPWAVITKTGCPFNCIFCDTHVTFGNRFITRRPEVIISELEENQIKWKLNKRIYMFIDDIFNEPINWAKDLLEKIIQSNLKIGFCAIIEPTSFDRELIKLLKLAGCSMAVGLLVSGSDKILEINKKGFSQSDIAEFLSICIEEKFPFMPQFMLGSPGETQETINETFDFINKFKLPMIDIGIGVRIQKETELYKIAVDKNIISTESNLLYPHFYFEPSLSLDWLKRRVKVFKSKYKKSYSDWISMIWQSFKLSIQN
jgi:radical SAM superfamily enzyme YgiQ (UPF0313 family)